MIVAGLGNPGSQYAMNRHNVGFLFLDHLAGKLGAPGDFRHKSSFDAELCEARMAGEKIVLVKPQSYMNLSGGPISRVASFYKKVPKDIVVIYDDVALPFGTIRIRPSGSAGGHNGMKSIIEQLGTEEFPRIRIGIAQEGEKKRSLSGYVLGNFSAEERAALPGMFDQCYEALELIARRDVELAMSRFNRKAAAKAETAPGDGAAKQR